MSDMHGVELALLDALDRSLIAGHAYSWVVDVASDSGIVQ